MLLPSLVSDGVTERKLLFKFIPGWAHIVWTDWGAYQLYIKSGPTTVFSAAHLKGFRFLLTDVTVISPHPSVNPPVRSPCITGVYHSIASCVTQFGNSESGVFSEFSF